MKEPKENQRRKKRRRDKSWHFFPLKLTLLRNEIGLKP